jgi:hypothetical protein
MKRNAPLSLEGHRRLVERCQTQAIAHFAAEIGTRAHRIDVSAIDDPESDNGILIFLHLEFLAIDRTLTHLVSPDATAVETL